MQRYLCRVPKGPREFLCDMNPCGRSPTLELRSPKEIGILKTAAEAFYIIRGGSVKLVELYSSKSALMKNSYSLLEYSIYLGERKIFWYLYQISIIREDLDPHMVPNWILIPMIRANKPQWLRQFSRERPGYIGSRPFRKKYGMDIMITALESLDEDALLFLADLGYQITLRMYDNVRETRCHRKLCDPLLLRLSQKRGGFVERCLELLLQPKYEEIDNIGDMTNSDGEE